MVIMLAGCGRTSRGRRYLAMVTGQKSVLVVGLRCWQPVESCRCLSLVAQLAVVQVQFVCDRVLLLPHPKFLASCVARFLFRDLVVFARVTPVFVRI